MNELSPGFLEHLDTRDTTYAMVSRAPLAKLERWKDTIDETVGPAEYNFRSKAEFEAMGSDFFDAEQPFEMPGRSCFLQTDGRVCDHRVARDHPCRVLRATSGNDSSNSGNATFIIDRLKEGEDCTVHRDTTPNTSHARRFIEPDRTPYRPLHKR